MCSGSCVANLGLRIKAPVSTISGGELPDYTTPDGTPPYATPTSGPDTGGTPTTTPSPAASRPTRFHGTVSLDATRVGRDASRIADEVIAHLTALLDSSVTVTLEIEAETPSGAPDHVVRTVTENSRTLGFKTHGFENE